MWFSKKQKKSPHLHLGEWGERKAKAELKRLGLEFLLQNYKVEGVGEVDLIFRDQGCLCFVEVKTRRKNAFSRPRDAVNFDKKERLRKSAKHYLKEINATAFLHRFDVVEVLIDEQGHLQEVCYLPNYFV